MGAKTTTPGGEPQGMLARGLSLLTALGDHPEGVSVTELARQVGLPVSTTHRLLATEIELGFVSVDASSKTYRLGVRLFELANRVTGVMGLASIARPIMRELSQFTGETTQLSVLSNARALFIEKVGTEQAVGIRGSVGQSEPLYATSTGKILLSSMTAETLDEVLADMEMHAYTPTTVTTRVALSAELERTREHDYALADEEFDAGVRAIGVPVRNGAGETRAALCISAPAFRASVEQLEGWLPELRAAAHQIGVRLPPGATIL